MYSFTFRQKKSLNERINEATALLIRHPTKIPIIVNVDKDISLKKYKYLVNINIPFLEFCNILRTSIKLNKEEGLTYIVGDSFCIPSFHSTIGELYHSHKSDDLFLIITIKKENIFG